jgi:hypothetical protein
MGDAPYNAEEEAQFIGVLAEVNRANVSFVVHVGDFKSGHSDCSDDVYRQRKEWFGLSHQPFVYLPGDNDWTDCWRTTAGNYQPAERLSMLRELFFSEPRSLGQRSMELARQTHGAASHPYPEHARWVYQGIVFATLNVPGGDNNRARDREEFRARDAAARSRLEGAFQLARAQKLAGVVIMMQANPWAAAGARRHGYTRLLESFRRLAGGFAGEVVLIHGDTHRFRVDHPLIDPETHQRITNFTRIEVFGSPTVNWLRVSVTHQDGSVRFRAEPGS